MFIIPPQLQSTHWNKFLYRQTCRAQVLTTLHNKWCQPFSGWECHLGETCQDEQLIPTVCWPRVRKWNWESHREKIQVPRTNQNTPGSGFLGVWESAACFSVSQPTFILVELSGIKISQSSAANRGHHWMQKAGNILPLIFVCIHQSSIRQLTMINTVHRRQLHLRHTVHKKSPTNHPSISIGSLDQQHFQAPPRGASRPGYVVPLVSLRHDGSTWNTFKGRCPGEARTM